MEKNENGYPVTERSMNEMGCVGDSLSDKPLGYAYVPIQHWRMLYTPDNALKSGTLFEELYLPMEVYGHE